MTEVQLKTLVCHRTLSADKPGQLCIGTACVACGIRPIYQFNSARDVSRNPDEPVTRAEYHYYCMALPTQ